jgi:hypothetical protein
MALIFKLPAAFVRQHEALLIGWDWRARNQMPLREALKGDEALTKIPHLAEAVIEAVPRDKGTVIRSAGPRSMIAVRKYAEAIEAAGAVGE